MRKFLMQGDLYKQSIFHKVRWKAVIALFLIPMLLFIPNQALGEVAPIEKAQKNLGNISKEEKGVLNDLFSLTQEMDALEQEAKKISGQIEVLNTQMGQMQSDIDKMQEDYNQKLSTLEQVLVYYQRGGPATYLDMLLSADSLSSFIKSINVIKDISRNVGELLDTIEQDKENLKKQRQLLGAKKQELDHKKEELDAAIQNKAKVKQKQEEYLDSLQEKRVYYEDQLENLTLVWTDCKALFSDMVTEINRVIGDGAFAAEDLNLEFGLPITKGALEENNYNKVISDNTTLPGVLFHFKEGEVNLEVPKQHLVLHGNFIISGDSAIQYEVSSGTFYDLPLDVSSIKELFVGGPLLIDFKSVTGEMVTMNFVLKKVESIQDYLTFEIELQW